MFTVATQAEADKTLFLVSWVLRRRGRARGKPKEHFHVPWFCVFVFPSCVGDEDGGQRVQGVFFLLAGQLDVDGDGGLYVKESVFLSVFC